MAGSTNPITPKTVSLLDNSPHTSLSHGLALTGWDYEGGWLLTSPKLYPDKAIWVTSTTDFCSTSRTLAGQAVVEIKPEPIGLTDTEKVAILGAIWDWQFWEPTVKDGTCLVQCLAKAVDKGDDDIKEMFKQAFRDPRIMDHAIDTLGKNGYELCNCGPNGFGYRERRLVTMRSLSNPGDGHVVLVYENDAAIFDSSGKFKEVSQLMWTLSLGWKLGDVFLIDKIEPA